jgi:ParB-like chromosome segregation protein Spo0J
VANKKNSPTAASMTIEQWDINRPIAYARNARKIPPSAVDKVAASIKEYGWRQPIVVDRDGVIVAGHTRLLAAKKLQLKDVPVHVAINLSPEQIKAYRLADNRTGEESSWDNELLALELKELESQVGNIDALTGFDAKEINRIMLDSAGLGEEAAVSDVREKYEVIVLCKNEQQQTAAIELLQAKGFECRALIA